MKDTPGFQPRLDFEAAEGAALDGEALIVDVDGYEGVSGTLSCVATGDCVPSARIAVYRAPDWPLGGTRATPVFSATQSLAEVTGRAGG